MATAMFEVSTQTIDDALALCSVEHGDEIVHVEGCATCTAWALFERRTNAAPFGDLTPEVFAAAVAETRERSYIGR